MLAKELFQDNSMMTEPKNDISFAQKAAIRYMLISLPKQVTKLVPSIDDNRYDHSYCINVNRSSNERIKFSTSQQNKDDENVNKVDVDTTENSIVKEEVIIPDLTEESVGQNIHLDTSANRLNRIVSTKGDKKTSVSLPVNGPIKITLEQYHNLSALNSGNTGFSPVLRLPLNSKSTHINNKEKNKSTVNEPNTKGKQIDTIDNNFIEIKEECVEADSEDQNGNRNKRFYHVVCLTCKKLRKSDDTNSKCTVCQNIFWYECLRCRDILSSQDEYYNHLKLTEFCPEIKVPLFLKNDSYAIATVMERNQCTSNVWDRAQKLISRVKMARNNSVDGKFKRIKMCCPICDETHPVDNGNFWCVKCDTSSVFHCQTCLRNYTTYCGAIYHTEHYRIRTSIYKCSDCSFKHNKKRTLFTHIRQEHLLKGIQFKRRRSIKTQCPDCNLIIKSSSYWMKHEYTCRKKIYFKCTLCTEKYLVKEDMRLHLLAAHEKTDSQALELIKQIENDRNKQEKRMKQKKQRSLNRVAEEQPPKKQKSNDTSNRCKVDYIVPYCIHCNETYEHLKISHSNTICPKCKSTVGVQCKFCKKFFDKYMTAYYHITKKCEKIREAKLKERNGGSVRKAKENTDKKNLSSNNECPDFIFEAVEDLNNDAENNSTLDTTEMHLENDIDIEIESQDIKIFASPLDFDEVIIPDKVTIN